MLGNSSYCNDPTLHARLDEYAFYGVLFCLSPFALLAAPLLLARSRASVVTLLVGAIAAAALWAYFLIAVYLHGRAACEGIGWGSAFGTIGLLLIGGVVVFVALIIESYSRRKPGEG